MTVAVPIALLDGPEGFPVPELRARLMVDPPDRLRVAFHKRLAGVVRVLGPGEGARDVVWAVVDYVRDESAHVSGRGVNYRMERQ